LAYLLAKRWNWGPTGVYISIGVAEAVLAIVAVIIFRQGKWKKVKV
jgi:Na+-driven multidrug efflux pump